MNGPRGRGSCGRLPQASGPCDHARMLLAGTCLCEAHAWQVDCPDGRPLLAVLCHCSRCRAFHGSGYSALAVFGEGFAWLRQGEAAGDNRRFCSRCGSPLPIPVGGDGPMGVPAGNLDGGLDMSQAEHLFCASRAGWDVIADERPQHPAYPHDWEAPSLPDPDAPVYEPGVCGGRCLCGDVRYRFDEPALLMGHCHCSRCRRSRGTPHATNLFVEASAFRWTAGVNLVERFDLPQAQRFGTCFCRHCGALLPRENGDRVNIPAGSLDGDPGVRPSFHIYTASGCGWFKPADGLPQFEAGRT